jgi:hypothetical protein
MGGASVSGDLSVEKAGRDLVVRKGTKPVFTIPVDKNDEAFVAGRCVVVRRNVRRTELFPTVDRIDVFQPSGRKRVYSEANFAIRHLNGVRRFTAPDRTWTVIPDEEEGRVSGFFLVSVDCRISQVAFPQDAPITWETIGGSFTSDNTLFWPALEFKDTQGHVNKISVRIFKDGRYRISRAQ